MPFQHVIAFAKTAAQSAQDAAVAGGQLNAQEAAVAARRATGAAHATYLHALVDLEHGWDDPTSALNGTARRLSELATDAAWAAKAVAQALAHEDSVVAREAGRDAHEAAVAALAVVDATEAKVTDPGSELGREVAQQAMKQAAAQAAAESHDWSGPRPRTRDERGGTRRMRQATNPRRGRARFPR